MADTEYTINIETQPEYTLEIGTLPGAINWGVIEGLLSLQTDLQSALNEKTNNESYTSFVTSTTESLATISSTLDTKATISAVSDITDAITSTLASHTTEMATTTQNGHMTTTQVITLTNSADTDLSNLTTTGKSVITSLPMPDYSNRVSKTWNTLYEATEDGWLNVGGTGSADTAHAFICRIYSDSGGSVQVGSIAHYGGSNSSDGILPIPKGYYYKASSGVSGQQLYFIPCKGA